LTKHFGAEIIGIDLSSTLNNDVFEKISSVFYKYSVLLFRDQHLSKEKHVEFTRRFGSLISITDAVPLAISNPNSVDHWFIRFSNVDENGSIRPSDSEQMINTFNANALWHSDGSFKKNPDKASVLYAEEVPPEQGETEFASLRAAYSSLPDKKKIELEGLVAGHSFFHSRRYFVVDDAAQSIIDKNPPAEHPIVHVISETGDKSLFISSHASHVIGWSIDKGESLINELMEFSTQKRFRYLHEWKQGDLIMWDNRCCLHRGKPWNSDKYKREMRRTTLMGQSQK
jgi:alpha-ketoglutarate-dependent 2,4-dichlorophenoxyacetate dioxygenase